MKSFATQNESFHWYLNILFETMFSCIQSDKQLSSDEKIKRDHICRAHLLYARNFYEMRITKSTQLKARLENEHACLIALACLFDSEVLRIVETHSCKCDTYVHLFSTKIKYCA